MKDLETKTKAFKNDLKALLEAHGAHLEILIEGDTHGVYDEGLAVSFPPKPGGRWDASTGPVRLYTGYEISASDLD